MSDPMPTSTGAAAERLSGRRRREALPRRDLGILAGRLSGFDPLALLEAQAASRIPELGPLRYERMAVDELSFLRGSAALMAHDLALSPTTGLEAQLCGDAHVANFGVFLSPERRLVFDVNDFDETLRGPFEWDVKRLMASAAVLLSSQGFGDKVVVDTIQFASERYRLAMREMAAKGNLDVWYQHLDLAENVVALKDLFASPGLSPIDDIIARAERSSSRRSFQKMTEVDAGRLRFRDDPPVLVRLEEILIEERRGSDVRLLITEALDAYAASLSSDRAQLLAGYEPVDMARKVVGVGSVGTRCFVILLLGQGIDDPLILQVKEAVPSVLESHLGPSEHENAGARVVAGQRLMQTTPDIFLGYARSDYTPTESHDFYLRQFHDGKASANLAELRGNKLFRAYLATCAWTLARAHARSGQRAAIAEYLGQSNAFDKAMASFALAYVERNRRDHETFVEAIAAGRLEAGSAGATPHLAGSERF
jgi:uncharacterized protein (DUF2252 family)